MTSSSPLCFSTLNVSVIENSDILSIIDLLSFTVTLSILYNLSLLNPSDKSYSVQVKDIMPTSPQQDSQQPSIGPSASVEETATMGPQEKNGIEKTPGRVRFSVAREEVLFGSEANNRATSPSRQEVSDEITFKGGFERADRDIEPLNRRAHFCISREETLWG